MAEMDVWEHLKNGVEVQELSAEGSAVLDDSYIRIDRAYYDTLLMDRELNLAAQKRFKGKATLYRSPDYKTLVLLCLSTDEYKVCSSNFHNICDDDVSEAWQFIDTISVSSTKGCRQMICRGKGSRSGASFLRSLNNRTRHTVKPRDRSDDMVLSSLAVHTQLCKGVSGEHFSIEEVMVEDCMKWVLESQDPVAAASSLRSNILSNTKGI